MFKRKHSSGIVLQSVSCEEQSVLWAPEVPDIFFSADGRGKLFCLTLCVYTQNIQIFVENSKMDEKHKKRILTPTRPPGRTLADGSLSYFPPVVYMQNDHCVMGIILRYV